MSTIDLEVQGMSCGSCVNHVTQALKPIPGVTDVAVDLKSGHVRVTGALDGDSQRLVSALTDAGYPARLADAHASAPTDKRVAAQPNTGRGGCCCR